MDLGKGKVNHLYTIVMTFYSKQREHLCRHKLMDTINIFCVLVQ